MSLAGFPNARRSGLEVRARLAAALGRGLPQGRAQETLVLQPFQGGIHTRKGDLPAALVRNIACYEHTVRVATRTHHGEQTRTCNALRRDERRAHLE